MATEIIERVVDATGQEVWKSWDDHGNIYEVLPALESSHLRGNRQLVRAQPGSMTPKMALTCASGSSIVSPITGKRWTTTKGFCR